MNLGIPEGDWSLYDVDDRSPTIHIPEVLDECLAALTDRFDQTKSDLARNALMLHVHGRRVFEALVAAKLWRLKRRVQAEDSRKFSLQGTRLRSQDSPRKSYIAAFGKSVVELKVWMPSPLHDRLSSLAIALELTPAEYMRRALTAYYLGRLALDPFDGRDVEF